MHTSEELPATGAPRPKPVFLDATGRRLKRARVVGGAVTAAVAAYVVLLFSAALGGPSIDAPFLPRPAAPTRGLAALPSATPMTGPQAGGHTVGTTTEGSFAATGQAAVLRGVARSTVAPAAVTTAPGTVNPVTSNPTGTPVPVATTGTPTPPVPTPTATTTHPGRSASAPGRTARPTVSRTR